MSVRFVFVTIHIEYAIYPYSKPYAGMNDHLMLICHILIHHKLGLLNLSF